jgi:hypothetical protein
MMGKVVDHELRVHGLDNVRVATSNYADAAFRQVSAVKGQCSLGRASILAVTQLRSGVPARFGCVKNITTGQEARRRRCYAVTQKSGTRRK